MERQRSVPLKKLEHILEASIIDDAKLRSSLWMGVPKEVATKVRPLCWKLAMGLLPLAKDGHDAAEQRRIQLWREQRAAHFNGDGELEVYGDAEAWKQVRVDLPRTNLTDAFRVSKIKQILLRVLLVWATKNPASGYVQGLNDILGVFVVVLLMEHFNCNKPEDVSAEMAESLDDSTIDYIEATAAAYFGELISLVQDNYVYGQPGIRNMLNRMRRIINRLDPELLDHLLKCDSNVIEICCLRWMNCLLVRELPLSAVLRLWDAYIAEGREGFPSLHVYTCSALLMRWRTVLLQSEFDQVIALLQNPPTSNWDEGEIASLLSEA